MDFEYEDQYKDLPLKRRPSEYRRRQCKATFRYDRVGTKLIEDMGVETLMWGSDYPHPDGVGPESEKYIKDQSSHLPADVTRKMTCENAGRFYGLIA
jgi:predicted TIM-barrel fold metal-dependent hydrolase